VGPSTTPKPHAMAVNVAVPAPSTSAPRSLDELEDGREHSKFVTRRGVQLFVGRDPFRYLGANIYWLMAEATYGEEGKVPTQSNAYLLTRSLAHSLTHSLTHLFTHSLTHLLTH